MVRVLAGWMALLGLLLLAGCASVGGEKRASAPPPLRREMLVEPEWLAENLGDPGIKVLHVAPKRDRFDLGHVPGAQFVAWTEFTQVRDGLPVEMPELEMLTALFRRLGINHDDRIVVYGEDDGVTAARMYLTLDYFGLGQNAALLNGQLALWKERGLPLEVEEHGFPPSSIEAAPNPSILASMDDVRLAQMTGVLIDARAAAQYSGETPGDGIKRPGHIPGAKNVPARTCMCDFGTTGRFKDELRLQSLYEEAGVHTDREVITYCRAGAQGALSYFTLKYLGYSPRVYDGSYYEWQGNEANPVQK